MTISLENALEISQQKVKILSQSIISHYKGEITTQELVDVVKDINGEVTEFKLRYQVQEIGEAGHIIDTEDIDPIVELPILISVVPDKEKAKQIAHMLNIYCSLINTDDLRHG